MYRVLIADSLAPEGLTILEQAGGIELDRRAGLKGADLREALAHCDGVIVRSGTTLTPEYLQGQTRLKVIVRAGAGVDNIDLPSATRAGIVVMNTPGGNTLSTAEHTMALLLAMARQLPAADAKLRAGVWDRKTFVGAQLAGKTLGVVGLGRVGLAVAKRAQGFEMKVIGSDPFFTPARAAELGIEYVAQLNDLFPRVDFLTIHAPLTPESKGMIGKSQIAQMPKGSYLINCARGGLVDEAALLEALQNKHLAGAALDVFEQEPPGPSPLLTLPNVVVTPHLGASTAEAQLNVAIEAAHLMVDFLKTGNVRFAVNMPSLDPAELRDVGRHLDIGYRLGQLQAQLAKGPIRRAQIEYRGEATKKKTSLITAAFTMGLLRSALEEDLNLVNARTVAAERGIEINEVISKKPSDFSTLVRTEVESEQDRCVASATTRGSMYNRLIRLGPYRLDGYLEGILLLVDHQDRPGLVGLLGTVLGKHDVNIAQMSVGRSGQGSDALAVVALDNLPPEAALAELRADERVSAVQLVHLPAFGAMPPGLG